MIVKNPPAKAGNTGETVSIPESGRSLGEGNGNPLHYSCLENPMDEGAWWATVHGVTKSWTQLSKFMEFMDGYIASRPTFVPITLGHPHPVLRSLDMWTLTLLPSTTPEATPTPTNHRLSGRGVLYETTCKSVLLNSRECQLLFFFPFSLSLIHSAPPPPSPRPPNPFLLCAFLLP